MPKLKQKSCNSQVEQKRFCHSNPLRESHLSLLHGGTFSDVTFIVGQSKERLPCHQLFLKARSPVFEVMFSDRWTQDSVKEVPLEDVNPKAFKMFLEYIYADTFVPNVSEALEMLELAHKYDVQLLAYKCVNFVEREATLDDAVAVFQVSLKLEMLQLTNKAGDLMAKSLPEFINHSSVSRMDKDNLMYILKRRDLNPKEVDLFRLAAQWAKNQSGLTCEQSLDDILPHIRFPIMTLEDFATTVVPSGILSQSRLLELFKCFGANAETGKSLANTLTVRNQERAIDNELSQVCRQPTIPVEICAGGLSNCGIRVILFAMDDVVSFPGRPPALARSDPNKNVVLSGMSVYCPSSTTNANEKIITNPSTKEFRILVKATNSYCPNHDVFTLSTLKAEEGKVTEVEFDPRVPLGIGNYFCFTTKKIKKTLRVWGEDYEVKDFGTIIKSVITAMADSPEFAGFPTETCHASGGHADSQLVYKLGFEER